jgi:hypothetical protein
MAVQKNSTDGFTVIDAGSVSHSVALPTYCYLTLGKSDEAKAV